MFGEAMSNRVMYGECCKPSRDSPGVSLRPASVHRFGWSVLCCGGPGWSHGLKLVHPKSAFFPRVGHRFCSCSCSFTNATKDTKKMQECMEVGSFVGAVTISSQRLGSSSP